jgi:hypothetical protein
MWRQVSKRRWIARYRLGKLIPREAIENHRGLWDRLKKIGEPEFLPLVDYCKLKEPKNG